MSLPPFDGGGRIYHFMAICDHVADKRHNANYLAPCSINGL